MLGVLECTQIKDWLLGNKTSLILTRSIADTKETSWTFVTILDNSEKGKIECLFKEGITCMHLRNSKLFIEPKYNTMGYFKKSIKLIDLFSQ